VVDADYNYAFIAWAVNIFLAGKRSSPVYLYFILKILRKKGEMMKRILIISLVIAVLVVFASWNNAKPANIIARVIERNKEYSGELKYRIDLFGIFSVGEAIIMPEDKQIYLNKQVLHLSASAKTPRWLSQFFVGKASVDSYFDTRTIEPMLFKEKVILGDKPVEEKEITYDQQAQVMTIEGERRHILSNTHDPLSALASIRRMDFGQIKDFKLNINTNQKNYILEAVVKPLCIVVAGKKYQIAVLKAGISRQEGNPYHKSKITMSVLRDKENLPLLIKVFAGGVFFTAKLTEIK